MYCVADQMLATSANHKNITPPYDRPKKLYIANISRFGIRTSWGIHSANNNAHVAIICNVVLILPMEKRAFGTGISIFCVPKNSRRPLMYSSREIIKITGITIVHAGKFGIKAGRININTIDNTINVLATNSLSPMWSITPPSLLTQLYLRARYPSKKSDKAARVYSINDVQYQPTSSVGIIAKGQTQKNKKTY